MISGSCNYQNTGCGCQTYLEDNDNPEKCFYCKHYIGFHFGFTNETSNYGACQKDFAHCGCQSFVASSEDELKCKYCDHYIAFHKLKNSSQPINNTLHLLTQIPTSSALNSNVIDTRQFTTPREEILANFRPQIVTPLALNPNPTRRSNNRLANRNSAISSVRGRPREISLRLNHILIFKDNSWKGQQPPRENNRKWNSLLDSGCIAANITFNENTPAAINNTLSEAFSFAVCDWLILNVSTSRLQEASSQVIDVIFTVLP